MEDKPEEKPIETPAPPQKNDAQDQCIAFWEEFKKKCATVGLKPVPVTNLKQEVADSINQRERNLVQWIVNTFTQAQVIFSPSVKVKQTEEKPKEEEKQPEAPTEPPEEGKDKEEPKKK